jgi:ABC-type bacteriocin/lantibiotic exporter with double-glycine peptidase domain
VRFWRLKPHFAPPFALEHDGPGGPVKTLSVPGYRQVRSYSCGYTSVLMIAKYFSPDVHALDLYRRLGTDRDGTRQNAIVRELRSAGISVGVRYDMGFDRVCKSIDLGKPIIAYLNDAEHWLVLYGYGRDPDRVFVADPRPGHRCEELWQSYGPRLGSFGIVCSRRPANPERRAEPRELPLSLEPGNANAQLSLALVSSSSSSGAASEGS